MAATQMGWAFQFAPTGAFTLEANVIFETYALALAFAKTDPTAVVGKVISVQTGDEKGVYMIEAIGTDGSLKKVGSDIDLSNYVTKDQLTNIYTYKGTVDTFENLPIVDVVTGDVYNVESDHNNYPAGTNFAWNGSEWDALGGSIDLSTYITEENLNERLEDLEQDVTYENGLGLNLENNEFSIKLKSEDNLLTIDEDGLTLNSIKIDEKINDAFEWIEVTD